MLRQQALAALLVTDPHAKAAQVLAFDVRAAVDPQVQLPEPAGIPGRAAAPQLVRLEANLAAIKATCFPEHPVPGLKLTWDEVVNTRKW